MSKNRIKIPQTIQSKMHRLARLSAECKNLSNEIANWFEEHGYEIDPYNPQRRPSLYDDTGMSLSELSDGNDITEDFVSALEAGELDNCIKPFEREKDSSLSARELLSNK